MGAEKRVPTGRPPKTGGIGKAQIDCSVLESKKIIQYISFTIFTSNLTKNDKPWQE
jgi:hypothetical protein